MCNPALNHAHFRLNCFGISANASNRVKLTRRRETRLVGDARVSADKLGADPRLDKLQAAECEAAYKEHTFCQHVARR